MSKAGLDDQRPDPDALLALFGREGRGRLKVFLGAAPGVGKTYAMLQGARRLRDEGVDVVIGLVETHGRADTAALLETLEVLPRRIIDYRDRRLEEFDLDAALARRPKLLILDELAHSNPAECRHPKRWQDAQELLKAGIDVWTALNIQHLESLADVVSRITGVSVRETVPDIVLRDADDVVLVDITPDELLERLKAGKVYVPETARRAMQNFFTTANLTALRELALRRTADRVDDQVAEQIRPHAPDGPRGGGERLAVCFADQDGAEFLVRNASRLATGLNASWIAVHLSRPGEEPTQADVQRSEAALQLAERLGGEVTRLSALDPAGEILRLAGRESVTQIIVARAPRKWWARIRGRSLPDALIRRVQGIAIHVVASETPSAPRSWNLLARLGGGSLAGDIAVPIVSVACAVGIGQLLTLWLRLPNVSMIFLAAVLFCALRLGLRAAIVAALLSFLAYNFFFIGPLYTFTVAEPHELFALLIYLIVAVLTGSLAGRVRNQSRSVMKRAAITQSLYDFSRKMSAARTSDDVLWASAAHINKTLGGRAVLLIPKDGDLEPWSAWPPDTGLDTAERSAARWALEKAEPAGWRTGTLPDLRMQFRPLATQRGIVGVCGFGPADRSVALGNDEDNMLSAILDQTAIALDRAQLVHEAAKAAALANNEEIRDALLASLSHDLRTPLASITGAVTSLRELGDHMSPQERQELLASIEQESARLSRFIANLLDMSRIESGALSVRRDWVDVGDVIRAAVARAQKAFPEHSTLTSIEADLPFIRGDSSLLEQVIFNLLDNAHKYGADAEVIVHARKQSDQVMISVTDEGPGIKASDLDRIFEKFYRGGRNDGRRAGTGLGLSICRGLVNAMGGTIEAQSPAVRRRGTRLVIRLPAATMPETESMR
jgi:two-component system sensor histidine kinase KdpD